MKKLKSYFFLIIVLFFSIKSIASTNNTINQLPSKTPDQNHLLAVDNLYSRINHKLKTHFNVLDLNIYLSGLPTQNLFKKSFF